MTLKTKVFSAWIILSLIVMACTISAGGGLSDNERLQTAVAQTVTAAAQAQPQNTQPPSATLTVAPTNTQQSPPTSTPKPCNKGFLVNEDPQDNADFNGGDDFDKRWRIRNDGTCTWTTSYKFEFKDGSKMGGQASQNLPQNVAPGETIDIIIDQTAPGSTGTYRGNWQIVDGNGVAFYFPYVIIDVVSAELTTKTATLNVVVNQGGSVYNNGDVFAEQYGVGDNTSNNDVQSFLAFDISGIPSNANILEVKTDFSSYATLGDPFGGLGCLRMYVDSYRPLDVGDYEGGSPLGAVARWCNAGELSAVGVQADMVGELEDRLGNNYFPLRIQFNQTKTDSDNANDALLFGNLKLIVKYES